MKLELKTPSSRISCSSDLASQAPPKLGTLNLRSGAFGDLFIPQMQLCISLSLAFYHILGGVPNSKKLRRTAVCISLWLYLLHR